MTGCIVVLVNMCLSIELFSIFKYSLGFKILNTIYVNKTFIYFMQQKVTGVLLNVSDLPANLQIPQPSTLNVATEPVLT